MDVVYAIIRRLKRSREGDNRKTRAYSNDARDYLFFTFAAHTFNSCFFFPPIYDDTIVSDGVRLTTEWRICRLTFVDGIIP